MQSHFQQSCKDVRFSFPANLFEMSGLESDTAFVKALSDWAGMAPSKIALEASLTPTTILRPFKGTATTRISQPTFDKLRARFPRFPGWDDRGASPDQQPTRSTGSGETVEIIQLDLSLPMGSGATIDDYIESEPRTFDLAYVQGFTRTPAHRLRIARGVGDSMFPTLQSSDMVWIDGTLTTLNVSDKIWAVSINGAAAIKRLRPIAGGRVLVMSDNKTIGDYEVDRSELLIGGRVIRFARDL